MITSDLGFTARRFLYRLIHAPEEWLDRSVKWLIILNIMMNHKSVLALVRGTAVLVGVVSVLLGSLSPVQAAQSVTLAWNPDPGVAGYHLHYGTASGVYNQTTDVGNTTTATVPNLTPGLTYFFVVTAFNTAGLESLPSNEVSFTAALDRPAISAMQQSPNGGFQFTVTDALDQTDSVYASSDLATWTLLTTVVNTTGTFVVNDPEAANVERRFYRVTDYGVTTDPAGFITLLIAGSNGGQSRAFSFLGISMVNPVSYQGTITSVGNYSVTDANATWSANEFNGTNGEFFIEITSGPYAGLMADILATDAAGETLTTDDDLSSLLTGGELYRIRKHRTLGDVFGENNESGLNGGSSISEADEVSVLNPVTQTFLTYYFKTGGFGGTGWRSATDAVTDASGTTLYPDQGVLIVRKVSGDISLILTGTVKTGPTIVPVGANINMLANIYPAGTLTVANSGLYVGNDSLGLAGGETASSADEVRIFDGETFQDLFYKTGGFGGTGWRNSTDAVADAGNTQIPPGSSIYVIRKYGRPAFNWAIPQPF